MEKLIMKKCKESFITTDQLRDKQKVTVNNFHSILIIPLTVFFLEVISKIQLFNAVFDDKFIYMFLLAWAMGFFIGALPMLLPGKFRRWAIKLLLFLLALLFSIQLIYFNNFHNFYTWRSLGEAGGAAHFWREGFISAGGIWYMLAAVFFPFVLFCVFGKKLIPDKSRISVPMAAMGMAAFLCLYFPALLMINSNKTDESEDNAYRRYTFIQNDIDQTFRSFGILNATRLDVKQIIFGAPVEQISVDNLGDLSEISGGKSEEVSETDYGWNVMDIDFDNLDKNEKYTYIDNFFKSAQPSQKNEYTGCFKGKNLIFITIESFCSQVVDPEFTPLLYKMSTEGFRFNNFYNPMWGGSTASGEYAIITGNFSPSPSCLKKSVNTYQPFALGNQFSKAGYKTLGYHNYSGFFYKRDASHPNFGYEFKCTDSGLKLDTQSWPNSDKEMADATIKDYSDLSKPFHVYYMTMSGHMKYNFFSNDMAVRHMNDLPEKFNTLGTEIKAYYSCQYEVELMLRVIVDALEKSGKLQDTVFAMSADHYPYAMSDESLAKLYGIKKKEIRYNPDLYKNSFILWTPSMTKPIDVDTPCCTVDILPTLCNMFDLEYDSRLILGNDIMSNGMHIVPLKLLGWSWVSTQGVYNAGVKKF